MLESLVPNFGDEVLFVSNEAYDMWAALELETGGIDEASIAQVNEIFESFGGKNENLSWDQAVDQMVEAGDFHNVVYLYENYLRDIWNKGVNIAKNLYDKVSQSIKNGMSKVWTETKSVFGKAYGRFKDDLAMYGMDSYTRGTFFKSDLQKCYREHGKGGDDFDKIVHHVYVASNSIEGNIKGEKISSILDRSMKWMRDYGIRNYGNNIALGLYVLARPFYQNINTGNGGDLWAASYINLLREAKDKFCHCDIDLAKMAYAAASVQISLSGKTTNELFEYIGAIHDIAGTDYGWWSYGSVVQMASQHKYPYKPDGGIQAVHLSIQNVMKDRRSFVEGLTPGVYNNHMIYDYMVYVLNNQDEFGNVNNYKEADDIEKYNSMFETFEVVNEFVSSHTSKLQPLNESFDSDGVIAGFEKFCHKHSYPIKTIDGGYNPHSMILMLEGITSVDKFYIMESNAGFNSIVPGMRGASKDNMAIVSNLCENTNNYNTEHLQITGDLSRVYEFYTTEILENFIGDMARKAGNYVGNLKNRVVKGIRGFVDNAGSYMSSILKSARNRIKDYARRAYEFSKASLRGLGIKNGHKLLTDYSFRDVDEITSCVSRWAKVLQNCDLKSVNNLVNTEIYGFDKSLSKLVYSNTTTEYDDISVASVVHNLGALYYSLYSYNRYDGHDTNRLMIAISKRLSISSGIHNISELIAASGVLFASMVDDNGDSGSFRHYMYCLNAEFMLDTNKFRDDLRSIIEYGDINHKEEFEEMVISSANDMSSGDFASSESKTVEASIISGVTVDEACRMVFLTVAAGVMQIMNKFKSHNNVSPTQPDSESDGVYGSQRFNESMREIYDEISINCIGDNINESTTNQTGFETPLGLIMGAHVAGFDKSVTRELYENIGNVSLSDFMSSGDVELVEQIALGNVNESLFGYLSGKTKNVVGRLGRKISDAFKSMPSLRSRIERIRDVFSDSTVPYNYVVNGKSVLKHNAEILRKRGISDDKKFCVLEMIWNPTIYFGVDEMDGEHRDSCVDFMNSVSWAVSDGYVDTYIDDTVSEWDASEAFKCIESICRENMENWIDIRSVVKNYIDDIIKSVELT